MQGIFRFSEREVKDIAISVLALSFVFSYPEIVSRPYFFLISLLVVGTAFMGHELSHRFVARKLGYFAEYRMWEQGILIAVLLAIGTGGNFVFAAPGAVVFASYNYFSAPRREDIGRIGIAGVVFNTVLMYFLMAAYIVIRINVLAYAGIINGWLALFNLIPVRPLDGEKVFAWDRRIWAAVVLLALAGFVILSVFV